MNNPADYKVGLYIRLSQEDDASTDTQSQSVINQQALLSDYVQRERLRVIDTYIDDGWSGLNFDRPSFQRLIADIERGRINMVVTKDLSRLGRDYILTGHYLERYFPEHGVRYVAVLDGIDTGSNMVANDVTPFRAVINDMYAKDISRKVRSVLQTKRQRGEYVGWKPPYGYKRDPNKHGALAVDDEVADVVRRIFNMAASGCGIAIITRTLNTEGVLSPRDYAAHTTGSLWCSKTLRTMLCDTTYLGTMTQGRTTRASYKSRVRVRADPCVVDNTHPPLVSAEVFEAVQRNLESRRGTRTKKRDYMLKGMLFCHECGHRIGVIKRKEQLVTYCAYYRCAPPPLCFHVCSPHQMQLDALTEQVVDAVRAECQAFLSPARLETIALDMMRDQDRAQQAAQQLVSVQSRLNTVSARIDKVYADRLDGLLAEGDFTRIYQRLCNERDQLNTQLKTLQARNAHSEGTSKLNTAKALAQRFLEETPTRELLLALVDHIELTADKQVIIKFRFDNDGR